jgi:cytochrome c-type biogenesis protein CcmH/NrfF
MQLSIFDKNGIVFGQSVTYPLTLSVLSPVATWITTIATVLLMAALIIRSVRKRRKNPVEKSHE